MRCPRPTRHRADPGICPGGAGSLRAYVLTADDIEAHERAHGAIPEGAIVLINTGRAGLYPDRGTYMGTAERGPDAVAELHFPGLSKEGADLLVTRGIGAVGIDTPSIDYGQSKTFETHVALMTRNIPAFENVADMSALPMKIEGRSGSSRICRVAETRTANRRGPLRRTRLPGHQDPAERYAFFTSVGTSTDGRR